MKIMKTGTRQSRRSSYVVRRDGAYRVAGSRVSLDSVVYAYRQGESPESIMDAFPVLTLEQVYGAIAFYLAHRSKVDGYLDNRRAEYDSRRRAARAKNPSLHLKLALARRQIVPQR
jgi:uncharacterized protein (DUF433 family)